MPGIVVVAEGSVRPLTKLIGDLDIGVDGDIDIEIAGITADSRKVKPAMLFAAIPGASEDGAKYIEEAISKGAAAIVAGSARVDHSDSQNLVWLRTQNVRLAYARLCAAYYSEQPCQIVAVTGTNGKTSVAEFYRQLWALAGEEAASIGTLGLTRTDGASDTAWASSNTSPAPEVLHEGLQRLANEGTHHVAIEASSHGLDQYRLHGVAVKAAAFTNLSQDHLDYHDTMDAYFEAKARLFSAFDAVKLINADDVYGQKLLARHADAHSFGRNGTYLTLKDATPTAHGLSFKLVHRGQEAALEVPLYGEFQLENIMAAGGLALLTGMGWPSLIQAIPKLVGVRGRMEKIADHPSGAPIFIDYAHTPDALKHLLISLRAHVGGKLHVVFGCGGDRDKTKRAPMGAIAAEVADQVVVTDDNPRGEDPEQIRQQIIQAAPNAIEVADREAAIQQAISGLSADDLLVVAGKGHETYQIIGETSYEFNDAHKIKEALGAL